MPVWTFLPCPALPSGGRKAVREGMPEVGFEAEVRNRVGEGVLNEGCGAEWAQKVTLCLLVSLFVHACVCVCALRPTRKSAR